MLAPPSRQFHLCGQSRVHLTLPLDCSRESHSRAFLALLVAVPRCTQADQYRFLQMT